MEKLRETIDKGSENCYKVRIYDYIKKEWIYIGTKPTYEDALKMHNEAQFNYYIDKRYLLPKCVGLDFRKRKFTFAIWHKNKTIVNESYSSLQKVKQAKRDFINKVIG